jgi:acyl-CoA thioesterase-1
MFQTLAPAIAQAAPIETSKMILVVGDSLSAEYGLPRDSGWVRIIAKRLDDEHAEYQIRNASISGDTTSGGLSRLPTALQQHQPDIVIIELGSNDGLRGLSLSMTQQNLGNMIELAQAQSADVLLIGMHLPPNYGKTYTEQFHALFATLAKQYQTGLVPFLLDGIATDRTQFLDDGIHPNADAQPQLADNVWKELLPMLKRP